MATIKVYDDHGKLVREGVPRQDEVKSNGFVIRYELMGVIVMMIVQSLTAVWWASGVTANISYLTDQVKEIKSVVAQGTTDRYRGSDAAKDREVINDRINHVSDRVTILDKRLQNVIDHGSPITDKRLTVLEYKLGISNGSKQPETK